MVIAKFFHVLFVFIWIGSLMTLTRFMGYHVKEEDATQVRLALLYKRIYSLVQFPCMVVAVTLGLFLWYHLDLSYRPGWFHMKLFFAFGLIVCDLICGRLIRQLNEAPDHSRGVPYKILHGVTGLLLIGVLFSGIVVRDKPGEIRQSIERESVGQKR